MNISHWKKWFVPALLGGTIIGPLTIYAAMFVLYGVGLTGSENFTRLWLTTLFVGWIIGLLAAICCVASNGNRYACGWRTVFASCTIGGIAGTWPYISVGLPFNDYDGLALTLAIEGIVGAIVGYSVAAIAPQLGMWVTGAQERLSARFS